MSVNLEPQKHDKEKKIAEEADDDEEDIEEDDGDQEPGVGAEQLPQVGLGQVHRLVAVKVGQELRAG